MEKVKGHIQGNKTIVTQPKFEIRHLEFMKNYISQEAEITGLGLVLNGKVSMTDIEKFVYAYKYEFGKW